jgi:hypothetical protein
MKELKPTDLRIGNYVTHCDYTDGIFKVESITYQEDAVGGYVVDTIGGKNGTWSNPINCIEPIELTEEWFLKFGFDSLDTSFGKLFEFRTGRYAWLIDNFGSLHLYYSEYENIANVKYVHQLQNLYFALTGQELEVKF